jgi:hypothetical protein
MKDFNLKWMAMIILILCVCTVTVSATIVTTITTEGGTIASTGAVGEFKVIADSLPNGLSGFNISVALGDPAKAEIVGILFPSWAGDPPVLAFKSSVPADSGWVTVVDISNTIKPGASNVELATLRIRGDVNGTTGLLITKIWIDDDNGNSVPYSLVNGTITIGSTPPPVVNGTVDVKSTPTGASVFLNGTPKGVTPLVIPNLAAGHYMLRLEMAGYNPHEEDITVTAGMTTNVNWTLTAIPVVNGTVDVKSTPTGASVFLNGTPKGVTPLVIPNVSAGGYTLRLEATGYSPREEDITVTAGLTTNVNWTLTAIPPPVVNGTVSVQSTPTGASIFLNGTPRGVTPLVISNVGAGGYTLRLEAVGYYPHEENIIVTAGLTTYANWTLIAIPPTVVNGTVNVQSIPIGASVLLNGTPRGVTPLEISNVSAGDYPLRLEASGYYPHEEDITVTAGLTTFVNWTLTAIPSTGTLDITSEPSNANVFLDGESEGTTPLSIVNLAPGPYTVRIEMSGYQIWQESFNVTVGNTTEVNAVLILVPTPTPTPTPTPIPTTIQQGTGGLYVISDPAATVFIDGKERGKTGEVIDNVQAGIRNVTLFKPGYKLVSLPVKITVAQPTITPKIILEPVIGPTIPPTTIPTTVPTTVPTIVPTTIPTTVPTIGPPGPSTGSLFVYTIPFGCSVYIDDNYRGMTPGLYGSLAPGSHVLKISRTGYADVDRSFNVDAGGVTTLMVVMVPDFSGIASAFL